MLRVIEAVCVDSQQIKRAQIKFDESTGLIVEVGDLKVPQEELWARYDDDCYLFAGMGDVHIHAREDVSGLDCYKEDYHSAHRAMLKGGLAHAGDMPNNPIPPIDDESYKKKFSLSQKVQHLIWPYAGIGPATRPLSFPVPYKVYMGPSVGELFFKDLESLDQALVHYHSEVVSFHCEDPQVLLAHQKEAHHHLRRPVEAEVLATRDALKLIEKYQLKGKLCHFSSGEGLNLVRRARQNGARVWLEVTPQHLYFDIHQIAEKDYPRFQMNPPLRPAEDKKILLQALKNGEIDFLATDHAPHTQEEKERGVPGLTGLDTYGAFLTWLLEKGVSPQTLARVCAENPGDFHRQFLSTWQMLSGNSMHLGEGFGYLKKNFSASFTIIRRHSPYHVSKEKLATKVQHSPFEGITFPGQLEAVYVRGKKL
jgi:dihydroorotase